MAAGLTSHGTAFSIDSLIGPPPPRSGHLLYTGYPMFMPYRPLVLPQALAPAPLPAGLPPLAPLASFAGRLTNTFCAGLGKTGFCAVLMQAYFFKKQPPCISRENYTVLFSGFY